MLFAALCGSGVTDFAVGWQSGKQESPYQPYLWINAPHQARGHRVACTRLFGNRLCLVYPSFDYVDIALILKFLEYRNALLPTCQCTISLPEFDGTSNLFMSIRKLSDDRQIGTMTAYISVHHGTVDVGIMIGAKSVWGEGYGQDAWNTFVNWLLRQKEIRKLTAGTLACNYSMIKLMERSGMTLEGVRHAQEIVEDQPINMLYYAKFSDI